MAVQFIKRLNRRRLEARHRGRELSSLHASAPTPVGCSFAQSAKAFLADRPDIPISPQRAGQRRFAHSGNAGDVIYSLPAASAMASGRPYSLFLKAHAPSDVPAGHPIGNVRLNEHMIDCMLPLLRAQPSIREAAMHSNQAIDVELDAFRDAPVPTDRGNIVRWYCAVFAVSLDLTRPWLHADPVPGLEDTVLLARSNRYRNSALDHTFLRKIPRLAFVGIEPEFQEMRELLPHLEFVKTDDFLQLARAIRSCKLFIGNQSSPFAVAEALKVPRILEVFARAPNVIPDGPDGYEAWFQPQFELLVHRLMEGAEPLSAAAPASNDLTLHHSPLSISGGGIA